jgi:hypothetical protein
VYKVDLASFAVCALGANPVKLAEPYGIRSRQLASVDVKDTHAKTQQIGFVRGRRRRGSNAGTGSVGAAPDISIIGPIR